MVRLTPRDSGHSDGSEYIYGFGIPHGHESVRRPCWHKVGIPALEQASLVAYRHLKATLDDIAKLLLRVCVCFESDTILEIPMYFADALPRA